MSPKVTLCLAVFNGEAFLAEAINSLICQDFSDFELIITDNASTDGTEALARRWAAVDRRIRYVRNAQNIGAARNFNQGFGLARGAYFKWCSYDDLLSPNYIGACVRALEAAPDAVLAYGRTILIDECGREIGEDTSGLPDMTSPDPARRFYRALVYGGTMHESDGLFRRQALRQSSLHRLYYGSDRALVAEVALLGPFLRVPEAIFYNREHAGRSFKTTDKRERVLFNTGEVAQTAALEHWPLLRHLVEISERHEELVSRARILTALSAWALRPLQVLKLASEGVELASPTAQARLRRGAWQILSWGRRALSSART